ncbi:MAG: ral secretion pathway protein [Patescibacteria group bacterium]|jgi:type II secretion system protein G|nr:ral secretion pathway protein [Patescibacteria group bacterium]
MKIFKSQKGFTLIELMVVILIIAILGALGLVSFSQANRSARDGKRRADIEAVRQALLLRKQEVGSYYNLTGTTAANFNSTTANLLSGGYLSAPVPLDPRNVSPLVYTMSGTSNATTDTFCICADVENDTGNSSNTSCSFVGTPNTGTHYCARQP